MDKFINKLILGNCVDVMKQLPANSIDLVTTSPPYDNLRSYNNKIDETKYDEYFSFPFCDIVKELWRVLKPGGVVVWVVNDQVKDGGETGSSFRQALYFQSIGFKIYDTMIYHKNGSPFSEVGRYAQVFEYMFVFSKGKPKTVNLLKDKENKWAGVSTFGKPSNRQKDGTLKQGKSRVVNDYGTRYNVWNIANGKGFGGDELAFLHPATFPENLAEDHILTWSNEGDIVLDPMNGGGTTTKMAYMNKRKYIGIDLNEEYIDIAQRRIDATIIYTEENPNPKDAFLVSKEETLAKRQKTKDDKKIDADALKSVIDKHDEINKQFEETGKIDSELSKDFITFDLNDPIIKEAIEKVDKMDISGPTVSEYMEDLAFVHPNSLSILPMTEKNQQLIKEGVKTFTSRSDDSLEGYHRLGNALVIQLVKRKRISAKDFKDDEERENYAASEGFGTWNNLVKMIKEKRTKTLTEKFLEGTQRITIYDIKIIEPVKKEIETIEDDDNDFWN